MKALILATLLMGCAPAEEPALQITERSSQAAYVAEGLTAIDRGPMNIEIILDLDDYDCTGQACCIAYSTNRCRWISDFYEDPNTPTAFSSCLKVHFDLCQEGKHG